MSWEQVEEALRTDFQCEEGAYIQAVLKSAPKFGQWNSPAEDWVRKLCAQFSDLVVHLEAHEGEIFIPGMFSWSKTLLFGSCVGATPDGAARAQLSTMAPIPCRVLCQTEP